MTKIVVVGIMNTLPELLSEHEQASNVRRLMEMGCYGPLVGLDGQSPLKDWLTLSCGRRPEREHLSPGAETSYDLVQAAATFRPEWRPIWDLVAETGGPSFLIAPATAAAGDFSQDLAYVIKKETDGVARDLFCIDQVTDHLLPQPANLPLSGTTYRDTIPPARNAYQVFYERLRAFEGLLQLSEWAYVQVIDNTLDQLLHHMTSDSDVDELLSQYVVSLDEELGKVLNALDDDTVFALVSFCSAPPPGTDPRKSAGAFVIAGPNCSACSGPTELQLVDFAPTLLAAAGHEIPSTMQGTSHFGRSSEEQARLSAPNARELELLRERLSGLGYIG